MKEAATKLGSNGATLIPTSNPKLDQGKFGGVRDGIFSMWTSARGSKTAEGALAGGKAKTRRRLLHETLSDRLGLQHTPPHE